MNKRTAVNNYGKENLFAQNNSANFYFTGLCLNEAQSCGHEVNYIYRVIKKTMVLLVR